MGLFDQVAGAISGSAGTAAEGESSLLGSTCIWSIIPKRGLFGIVQSFQKGGLDEIINSWV